MQQGLIKSFLLRTAAAVLILTSLVLVGMWMTQDWVSWALFGSVDQKRLLLPACITLLTNITYNYFLEVTIALRRIRIGSLMELVSSWTFAIVAIGSLWLTDLGAFGVILGYAAGNLCGAMFAGASLLGLWQQLPVSNAAFSQLSLWKKLAPFALGLWGINIVTNLFDLSDRYMIVHFSGVEPQLAQGLVGQYFSSMAVPLLMVGISTTLAHLVMPYLSQDWENGKTQAVSARVNLSFKMLGLLLCFASAGTLVVAPLLFDRVFDGKYNVGLSVLPFTVAFCYWRSISFMAYNYLYCVERTRLMCLSLFCSLVVNVVLNALLLPPLGLVGAALSTTISSILNLVIILIASTKLGFQISRGVWWVMLFPVVFLGGAVASTVTLLGLVVVAFRSNWFFTQKERSELESVATGLVGKVVPSRWLQKLSLDVESPAA